jgi:hypothetical protein
MAPILGIYASSASPNVYNNSYESIATVTVGSGGSSSISFTSIPSTYQHLQIRMTVLSSASATDIVGTFNSDPTGSNYKGHYIYGSGTSLGAGATTNYIELGLTSNSTTTPAVAVADIIDYANTSKYKVTRTLTGTDGNGSGYLFFESGLWMNTAAITSITLTPYSGTFNQYSSFALYGVKG